LLSSLGLLNEIKKKEHTQALSFGTLTVSTGPEFTELRATARYGNSTSVEGSGSIVAQKSSICEFFILYHFAKDVPKVITTKNY
jgi:hypothetical protein